ncbi:MAG: penicillin acylase family protein [Acidimicrobiia bacterium]|nr:penicillin acylase family protein [Acidimicrobiia bacterium]
MRRSSLRWRGPRRRSRLRWLWWTLLALAVLAAGFAAWALLPESAGGDVAGLDAVAERYDATIARDEWGIPHVVGPTNEDVAYGLAYAHAEDDFPTIQHSILAARGELATVLGRDGAPNDYLVGLLRVWDTMAERYETDVSPEVRRIADAYADGLNHYAALHPGDALVGLFPVTGEDVVATSVHKSPLFFGLEETFLELFEEEDPREVSERFGEDAFGSNVLAVGPTRSAEGGTLFVSNSHQPWEGPVAWYEASVHSDEGWNVSGALFPSMPVFALGTNGDLAWSFTVNHPDLVDVYRLEVDPDDETRYRFDGDWRDFEIRSIPIRVKLFGRFRWTFHREALWTEYGPAVRRPHGTFAIRYAGMGLAGIYEQLFRMSLASSYEEWAEPLRDQSGLASFNVGYADRTGTVGYVYHGLLPQRSGAYDWSLDLPGTTSETLWTDYLPFDRLPALVDPAAGFVQNANSTPFDTTGWPDDPAADDYPATFGIETYPTNRSLRAQRLLDADPSISLDDLLAVKFDRTYDADSAVARWRDRLAALDVEAFARSHDLDPAPIRAAVTTLSAWDLRANLTSRGMALMGITLTYVYDVADEDDRIDFDPSRLTEATVPDDVLELAFADAIAWLVEHHGRVDPPWGEVNRLRRGDVDLPVAGGPDLLRAVYGERSDDGTLEGIAGDAYVLVVAWDRSGTPSARAVHQYGSSTLDEDSPHYADQAELFVEERFRPVPLTADAALEAAVITYRPGEED